MNIRIIFSILLFSFLGCNSKSEKPKESITISKPNFDHSKFQLQQGDILFQDSDCGPFCEAIEKVTFGVDGAKFSHVGLVIARDNNTLAIIEAIGSGVEITPLDTFFNRSFDAAGNSKVVVGRLKKEHQQLIPSAIEYAKTKLGKPYDDVFNILNDKYYCSELLYESFSHANDGTPIFDLQKMTYKDPDTKMTFPIWEKYFADLGVRIPEDEPGLNPGGMSRSRYLDIVHFYGKPEGVKSIPIPIAIGTASDKK